MISSVEKIATSPESMPFMAAARQMDLEGLGYEEEEYFFSGTANVYGKTGTGSLQVLAHDAPYTNRFLVRRPKDAMSASGRVVVEIVNSSSFIDIDRVWVLIHRALLRNGDVWIGVTSKPITIKTLRKYDPERYAPLSWRNPRPCFYPAAALGNFPGASNPETEDGLLWDMLTELGLAVRQENTFLGGVAARYVYLVGWSQSGSDMIVYNNWFARERHRAGLPPVYNGHFCCAPGPSVCPGLNQEESMDISAGDATLQFSSVPFWQMQTESENARLGTLESRLADSDSPGRLYRGYDIAGATHDSFATMDGYYLDDTDAERTGIYLTYPGAEPDPNDFPYTLAFQAAYRCLCEWCEQGVNPPRVACIPVAGDGSNGTDADGNALGGWRLPELDCPVCVYRPCSTPLIPNTPTYLYGAEIPFSPEKLQTRYGSLAAYAAKVQLATEQAVASRLLDKEDGEACVQHAVEKARHYGLK